MNGKGSGPGGPHLSSAKKRRLAALERRGGSHSQSKRQAVAPLTSPLQQPEHELPSTSAPQNVPKPENPVYEPLDEMALDALTAPLGHQPAGTGTLAGMLQELMGGRSHVGSDAQSILNGKLKDKALLLENPSVVREQGRRMSGGTSLSGMLVRKRRQRETGLYDLKNIKLKFQELLPLHERWKSYIYDLCVPSENKKDVQQRVVSADLHGAFLRVAEARESRVRGVSGIVIRDSVSAFHVVTKKDRCVVVPKRHCVFEFRLDATRVVTLLGDGLIYSALNPHSKGNKPLPLRKQR